MCNLVANGLREHNMGSFLGPGPFYVSGTSYRLLQLGEQPSDSPPPAPAAIQIPPAVLPAQEPSPTASAGKKRKSRQSSEELSDVYLPSPAGPTTSNRSKGTGGTTLYEMIEAGVLQPGANNATVTYKGTTYTASLQSNGTISFRGTEFSTPSAFSVYVKRLITPNKQGDDGWHSVSIDGVMLHHLRTQYLQHKQEQYLQSGGVLPPLPVAKRPNSSKATSKQKLQRAPSPRPQSQSWQQSSQPPQYPQQQQQPQRPPSPALQQQQQVQSKPAGMQFKLHIKPPRPVQPQQPQQQPESSKQQGQKQQQGQPQQPSQQQQQASQQQQQQASQQHQQQQEVKPAQQSQQQLQELQPPLQQQRQTTEQQSKQPVPQLQELGQPHQPHQVQQIQQPAPLPQQPQQPPTGPPPLKKLKLGKVHLPSPKPAAGTGSVAGGGAGSGVAAGAPLPAAAVHKPVIKLAMKPSSAAVAVAAAFAGTKSRSSLAAAAGGRPALGAGLKSATAFFGAKSLLNGPRLKGAAGTGSKGSAVGPRGAMAGPKGTAAAAAAGFKGKAAGPKATSSAGASSAVNGKYKRAATGAIKSTGTMGKAGTAKGNGTSSQSGQQHQEQQRVKCSRCELWRSVPAQEWPRLQADNKEDWFCEDATWELTKFEPFTPGCLSDMWAEGEA